jgi:hypothetical protein
MPKLPSPNVSKFEPVPEGSHAAACCRIIDLGTQQTNFNGQVTHKRQIILFFEVFSEERRTDGRPFTIAKTYTWSMSEKATLRHDLESWRGKKFAREDFGPNGFSLEALLGKPCLLTVMHENKNGEIYSKISAITRLPKSMVVGGPEGETLFVWLEVDEFDPAAFEILSDKLKDKIRRSPEYQAVIQQLSPSSVRAAQVVQYHDDFQF